ncbi:hypothetical protein [Streptomyces sp. NPDC057702]|uniref:hypothetical protein n=1 Tax=Streptomyces sp. NPDC057702 TaxID=3346221 RepID=UPI0036C02C73
MPHDTGRTWKDAAVRCRLGSNRRLTLDVTITEWQKRLEEGGAETGHRRPTTVLRKPRVEAAPALSQMVTAPRRTSMLPKMLEAARSALVAHRKVCKSCPSARCSEGREMEVWLAEARATERLMRETTERLTQERERTAARQASRDRRAQWRRAARPVRDADLLRADRPAGDAPLEGRPVPLAPQDMEAHTRRQVELGQQYTQRRPLPA